MSAEEFLTRATEVGIDKLVGPVLGLALKGFLQKGTKALIQERLDEFFEELRAEFTPALKDDYDHQFLQSQDFAHLVLRAADHAARARKRERRALYARSLRNAATKRWGFPRCDLAEELLNMLAELSDIEIRVLNVSWAYLRKKKESVDESRGPLTNTVTAEDIAAELADVGLNEAELRAYLGKLQRFGLTQELVGAILSYSGGNFRLTPLLARLMDLIADPRSYA